MAADLGGSQISALLESVPGIRNVLRSPVADAMVNMIRAAAQLRPFSFSEADELVQYAVRRGLISASEGEQVLADVRDAETEARRRARAEKRAARKTAAKPAAGKKSASRKAGSRKVAPRKPVKKAGAKPAKKRR
jgi:urease accessory protein UreF